LVISRSSKDYYWRLKGRALGYPSVMTENEEETTDSYNEDSYNEDVDDQHLDNRK
jgi:hypothetical protein